MDSDTDEAALTPTEAEELRRAIDAGHAFWRALALAMAGVHRRRQAATCATSDFPGHVEECGVEAPSDTVSRRRSAAGAEGVVGDPT